jgi:hypothetical protein
VWRKQIMQCPFMHISPAFCQSNYITLSIPFSWTPLTNLCDSFNTLRTGSFKLFKRPFLGFLTILTL